MTFGIARRFNAKGYTPNRLEFGFWGAQSFAVQRPLAGPFSVSLAGVDYSIDTSFEPYRREAFRHRSIPAMRESLNFDNVPGQGVVNTGGLWPRAQTDWTLGAGQLFLDHHKAVADRFYQSKGVNTWTEDELFLLQDTTPTPYFTMQGAIKQWVKPVQVGRYQYFVELDHVVFIDTTNLGAGLQTVTGLPAPAAGHYYTDITHNGEFVFVACGTQGIWYVRVGSTGPATQYVSQTAGATTGQPGFTITGVAWVADALWASGQQYLYVFGSTTTVPSTNPSLLNTTTGLATTPNPGYGAGNTPTATIGAIVPAYQQIAQVVGANWVWTNIVEGNSQIYVGGYNDLGNGVRTDGSVYRISQIINQNVSSTTGITTTTTTYAAPAKSLQLTPGEYPVCLFSYLNFIFIGTNLGVRMAETLNVYDPTATGTGDLKSGALIPNILQPVKFPVTSFTAQGRWVWFVWGNYDSTSSGIGRMDVSQFIDDLAPAYASDLMVKNVQLSAMYTPSPGASSGCFLMWDAVQNAPMIAIANPATGVAGCYSQDPNNLVASGTMNVGWLGYDVPDFKVVVSVQAFLMRDVGGVNFLMSTDLGNGQFTPYNTICQQTAAANTLGSLYWLPTPIRGLKFDLVLQLVRDTTNTSQGPILDGWLMKAFPAVTSETTITPVLSLFRSTSILDQAVYYEPYFEYFRLDQLRRSQSIVTYQEGPLSALVLIRGIDWLPEKLQDPENKGYNSVAVVSLETLNGFTYTPIPTHS